MPPSGFPLLPRYFPPQHLVEPALPAPTAGAEMVDQVAARGIHAEVDAEGTRVELESPLLGAHNLENLLVALGTLVALGVSPERAAAVLSTAEPAAGRLERCDGPGDDVLVVVDYAHTPDALERVLAALRPLTRGKLICVFGCGGDRDPGKRPKMGAAAAVGSSTSWMSRPPACIWTTCARCAGSSTAWWTRGIRSW